MDTRPAYLAGHRAGTEARAVYDADPLAPFPFLSGEDTDRMRYSDALAYERGFSDAIGEPVKRSKR